MGRIVVVAATGCEISDLIESFDARRCPVSSPWDIFEARRYSTSIFLTATGIGSPNASAATTALIHLFSPSLILNTGCAGAYPGSGLEIGDIALAKAEVFADTGVAVPAGWRSLEYMGFPLAEVDGRRYFNEIPLSPVMAERALRRASDLGICLHSGRFLTVSTCSGTSQRGDELCDRFEGICENMEGAAVALVAARYGVDCLEIRGVSNHVEDRDLSRWDIARATTAAQDYIEKFLETL